MRARPSVGPTGCTDPMCVMPWSRVRAPGLLSPPSPATDPPLPHTDKRAFFVICTSELGPPQIYELVALTSSDKNT